MNFKRRKKDILSKLDKSSKKSWDEKIVSLCKKINSLENFYTTSSCSGRIVLLVDNAKKTSGLFIKVWHEMISFEELKKELEKIVLVNSRIDDFAPDIRQGASQKKINTKKILKEIDMRKQRIIQRVVFKQEPIILHVACESLAETLDFLKKARNVGFKRGGIISGGRRFVLELIGTEKLEFPIISEGKLLVDDKFLKIIVKKANENLKKSWLRVGKLKNIL